MPAFKLGRRRRGLRIEVRTGARAFCPLVLRGGRPSSKTSWLPCCLPPLHREGDSMARHEVHLPHARLGVQRIWAGDEPGAQGIGGCFSPVIHLQPVIQRRKRVLDRLFG